MEVTIFANHAPPFVAVGVLGPNLELLRTFSTVETKNRRVALAEARKWCAENGHEVLGVEWSEARKVYL